MIPKLKSGTQPKFSPSIDKKRVNIATLISIIEHVDKKKCFHEFTNRVLLECEKHIKRRSATIRDNPKNMNDNIVQEFQAYYTKRYAKTSLCSHGYYVGQFINFVMTKYPEVSSLTSIHDCNKLTKQMVISYQEHLVQRMHLEQIQKSSVYKYLYAMKLFLDMLVTCKQNKIFYFIPESLRAQGKRSNEYVNLDEVITLLKAIEESDSPMKIRNMSIILLIMELGCRPIEVANLRVDDIRFSERLITLHSVKSRTRTLEMSRDLTDMLKAYHAERSRLHADDDMLFLNRSGQPISSSAISAIFRYQNKLAFGEKRFTAKALRHTYATNALDNMNDFDQVSESMGHKHRRSTEWYIHRSVQRLLKRSLPHNPLNQIREV